MTPVERSALIDLISEHHNRPTPICLSGLELFDSSRVAVLVIKGRGEGKVLESCQAPYGPLGSTRRDIVGAWLDQRGCHRQSCRTERAAGRARHAIEPAPFEIILSALKRATARDLALYIAPVTVPAAPYSLAR